MKGIILLIIEFLVYNKFRAIVITMKEHDKVCIYALIKQLEELNFEEIDCVLYLK